MSPRSSAPRVRDRARRRRRGVVLSAFVYRLDARPPLAPNHEVAEALWVPVPAPLYPARHVGYRYRPRRWPGVCVGDPDRHIVWGLTYRLLEALFGVMGTRFPDRSATRR